MSATRRRPAGRRRLLPPNTLPNLARRLSVRASRGHTGEHLFLLAREFELGLPFLAPAQSRAWLRRLDTWRQTAAFDLLQFDRLVSLCRQYEPEQARQMRSTGTRS